MALEIQNEKAALNGGTTTFTFDNDITQYLIGISAFYLAYKGDDHHIQQININLNGSQANSKQITVKASVVMADSSGNQIDTDQSNVYVTALAWTGTSTSSLLLSMPPVSVGNGQTSEGIPLPGLSNPILQPGLAGFNLNYGSDHHVEFVEASLGVGQTGSQGQISATVQMYDASGNQAQSPTANGVLLASSINNPGFIVVPYSAQNSVYNYIDMGQSVSKAVALLTGFQVSYAKNDDHHVQVIGAGPNMVEPNPDNSTQVQTNGVWAFMSDDDGNSQDNGKSHCNLIIVGLP
jgi:hypothetical protein